MIFVRKNETWNIEIDDDGRFQVAVIDKIDGEQIALVCDADFMKAMEKARAASDEVYSTHPDNFLATFWRRNKRLPR